LFNYIACLHDKNKSGFFGVGRLFSSQSELFENFQIALIGWIKAGPQKSHFCFDHKQAVNVLKIKQV